MADAMLLQLFRDEIATNLATIESNFDALDDAETDILETIARSAHSIKGAARIVDIAAAVRVAAALEALFDSCAAGAARVTRADLPVLSGGVATLRAIAAQTDAQLSAGSKAIVVDAVVTAISDLEKRPVKRAAAPAPRPAVAMATEALARMDATLLDLFRVESDTHGEALQRGLLALEQEPTRAEALQALMRAAHSIKGAARVVNVDAAVALAHVMEDCFVAAQAGRVLLRPADLDLLLQATDMLLAIGANLATLDAWTAEHGGRV